MDRYILTRPDYIMNLWRIKDTESGLRCSFIVHEFPETKKVEFADNKDRRLADEMEDWLIEHYYYIAMPLEDDKIDLYVGQQVSAVRQAKEMTRYRLSKLAGVREQHIAQIERGEVSPSVRILARIARALDCDFLLR